MKTVILAGSYLQGERWAVENKLDLRNCIVVSNRRDLDKLRGLSTVKLVRCGTYFFLPFINEIERFLLTLEIV